MCIPEKTPFRCACKAPSQGFARTLNILNKASVCWGVLSKGGYPLVFIPPFDTILKEVFKFSFLNFLSMSQIDDMRITLPAGSDDPVSRMVNSGTSTATRRGSIGLGSSNVNNPRSRERSFESYISNLTSGDYLNITDRSQIINPEQILLGFDYPNTESGQAAYSKALAALKSIQEQQIAAYEDWYNSPEQQVIRDRAAGLNPDILGLSGTQAAESSVQSQNPIAGLPTAEDTALKQEQIRSERANRIIGVVNSISSIANLATSFSNVFLNQAQKGLIGSQKQSLDLQNLKEFESLTGSEIASRLSDSISNALAVGQSLDVSSWFNDDANFAGILEAYSPDGSQRFVDSFSNVRNRLQKSLGAAYEQGRVTADNQSSFSAVLADPRYSTDQILQIAQIRPYMEAKLALQRAYDKYQTELADLKSEYIKGLDVESAVDAANAKFEYDKEYLMELDGKKAAIHQNYVNECNGITANMRSSINKNLLSIYEKHPNDQRGFAAAYLFDNAANEWYEYLAAQMLATDLDGFKRPDNPPTKWNGVEIPSTNPPSFTGATPSPSATRGFIYPGSVAF